MAAIIRLKRKACEEPADGLVIALKKPKCELSDTNEVLFKFAATLNGEKESIRDQIQAALSKEKTSEFSTWRNPKDTSISENKVKKLREKLQAEHKSANAKKKLDFLNNRRLILTEEFPELEDSFSKDAEVRQLFNLYDIIEVEENEDVKKQNDEVESTITCNDQPLIREKIDDYVFDVYIADGHIDQTFVKETVSVRPCTLTTDDIYFGDTDGSEECFEDEDDSNDENNWRNEYPEDADVHSNKDSDSYSDDGDVAPYYKDIAEAFNEFDIEDGECVSFEHEHDYAQECSRTLKQLREDYDDYDDDEVKEEGGNIYFSNKGGSITINGRRFNVPQNKGLLKIRMIGDGVELTGKRLSKPLFFNGGGQDTQRHLEAATRERPEAARQATRRQREVERGTARKATQDAARKVTRQAQPEAAVVHREAVQPTLTRSTAEESAEEDLPDQLAQEAEVETCIFCPICFHTKKNSEGRFIATVCGHIFCTKCIEDVMSRKGQKKCPTCRTELVKRENRRLYF